MQAAARFFQQQFGQPPRRLVQAPGRLELLGNHTDYNDGLVMSIAVDRCVFMAVAPRPDGRIALASSAFPERQIFFADQLEKNPTAPWANYVKGVLLQLRSLGVNFTGFNAAIHSTVPIGSGLSSSAALLVATALAVRELFPFSLDGAQPGPAPQRDGRGELPSLGKPEKLALAKLCQAAESQFVGANVGLLDHISSLFGRAGHAIQIDCRDLTVGHEPMAPGIAVVVCNSGVTHDLAAGDYNELRAQCEAAARALGVPALRSVDARQLAANRHRLTPREYACACHIVAENHRVTAGERALRAGDVQLFGQYLFQSHASSRDDFKNSCPELDILVELAQAQAGCLGARLTGGGFGGATINLVRIEDLPAFRAAMIEGYARRTGRELELLVCQMVDGARSLKP